MRGRPGVLVPVSLARALPGLLCSGCGAPPEGGNLLLAKVSFENACRLSRRPFSHVPRDGGGSALSCATPVCLMRRRPPSSAVLKQGPKTFGIVFRRFACSWPLTLRAELLLRWCRAGRLCVRRRPLAALSQALVACHGLGYTQISGPAPAVWGA